MTKIIDYTILGSNTSEGLMDLVKEHIKDGWQPYHGPYLKEESFNDEIGHDERKEIWIYQAMVKYEV